MKTVSRLGRTLDLVGLLLFLVGLGVFARAWIGFRAVPDFQATLQDGVFATVRLADSYRRLERIGAGIMGAGMLVFVVAWWTERRRARASV
jgi:Na+/glutamate symporter